MDNTGGGSEQSSTDSGDADTDLLRETIQQFLDVANYVVNAAQGGEWVETRKSVLHDDTYAAVRDRTDLHSNHVQSARNRAVDALKSVLTTWKQSAYASLPTFTTPFCEYNKRNATFYDDHATLSTVGGRVTVEYVFPDETRDTLHSQYFLKCDSDGGYSLARGLRCATMRTARVLKGTTGAVVAFLVAVLAGIVWLRRETARRMDELRRPANTERELVFTPDDLEGLPAPVRAYFENTLQEGQPYIDTVRLKQNGKLRLGDASSSWRPFTATQHVTVDPPGFFWDASISLVPFVSLRIRDLFRDQNGSAEVSLFGIIPLDRGEPSQELNEAELVRYLAEATWYPTALLPSEGVQWEPIDDRTARATIDHGDVSASLTFSFNEDDEVTRVYTEERYRRVEGGFEPTPWSGYWHNYQRRNGIRIPMEGEVIWHLPDGDLEAWQGQLTEINYGEL